MDLKNIYPDISGDEIPVEKSIAKILDYSFSDIGYNYRDLTKREKFLLREDEFANIVNFVRENLKK